jgi:biotin carboxyl carrier protein
VRYFVTVAGKTVLAERTAKGMVVGDREVAFDVEPLGTDAAHLRFGTRGARVTARRIDGGWTIRVDGREHAVLLEGERARAIREITGVAAATGTKDVRAPMPGLVVKVLVEPGQEVEPGDALIVVEAMKMENELRAEAPGIVERVEVTEGRAVERDEVLIRFGEEDE